MHISKSKDAKYDFSVKKNETERTSASIEIIISDFKGHSTDSFFLRANSRTVHVTNRIQRTYLKKEQHTKVIFKFKNETHATALKLEADLYDEIRSLDPNTTLNNSISDFTQVKTVPITVVSTSKSFPYIS